MKDSKTRNPSQHNYRAPTETEQRLANDPWEWKRTIRKRKDFDANTKVLADVLAEKVNAETGCFAWAADETYAELGGMSQRTVRDHLKILERLGLIRIENKGGGRSRTRRIYLAEGNGTLYERKPNKKFPSDLNTRQPSADFQDANPADSAQNPANFVTKPGKVRHQTRQLAADELSMKESRKESIQESIPENEIDFLNWTPDYGGPIEIPDDILAALYANAMSAPDLVPDIQPVTVANGVQDKTEPADTLGNGVEAAPLAFAGKVFNVSAEQVAAWNKKWPHLEVHDQIELADLHYSRRSYNERDRDFILFNWLVTAASKARNFADVAALQKEKLEHEKKMRGYGTEWF